MNNRQTELFWELLANPADKNYAHVQNLRQLVSEYPQSSLLQSLLVYTGEDDNLGHASVYTDPRLLYKLRNDASGLSAIDDNQLIKTISEKRYFHTEDTAYEPEVATASVQETHNPFSEAELEQQELVDEYRPSEHFFEPEVEQPQAPLAAEPEIIAEPEHLSDLVNYGDEVTTGEHELHPPVTEFYHQPQHETEIPDPDPVQEATPVAETVIQAEPVVEQEIPLEETQQEPQPEQQIELPTLGFYVPGMTEEDDDSYSGGDISSRLYESYAKSFENTIQPAPEPIEDDVYDEIVGIDNINLPESASLTAQTDDVPQSPQPIEENNDPTLGLQSSSAAEASKEDPASAKNRRVDLNDEAEKLMLNNIAATDFFVFDQALSQRINAGDEVKGAPASQPAQAEPERAQTEPVANQPGAKKTEYKRVTKYFDEKMPYSFMWWLDKTRREHSGIYQPYVEFKLDTSQKIEKDVPDELQQQYYENIFQLTSVDELQRATGTEPVMFDSKKKEDEIIERFIHEAPQIKPQTSDKLDNENKAKRSSEDQDEIVTETLAQVYADQMLYHKAIKVYQKLMLKFPEKRRYFAGQIEQLEKKIS